MSDYIKREDAYQAIADNNYSEDITLERYDAILESIGNIQPADVRENVHAHWVEMPSYTHHQPKDFECSACHESEIRKTRFCPNCGAIMDEEAEP